MVKIVKKAMGGMQEEETYICTAEEFTSQTDKPDGTELQVVDTSAHKVTGYYVAFGGYWNKR